MVQSYKNESKSQQRLAIQLQGYAVMYGTKLQKWEQITTSSSSTTPEILLWCMVQSYKNESKSQHRVQGIFKKSRCDVWYKVTKMRANHNQIAQCLVVSQLWCMVQSYKNESKSLRGGSWLSACGSCDVWYKVTKMRANHNCLIR